MEQPGRPAGLGERPVAQPPRGLTRPLLDQPNAVEATGGSPGADPAGEEEICCQLPAGASTVGTTVNALNVLVGVGLLTVPYALASAGWVTLLLMAAIGVACCYTGNLLRKCVDCKPGCKSYPEIGLHAFGQNGRKLVAFLLYLELFGCAVTFLLLPADNLAAIFPRFRLYCFGACKSLTTTQAFVVLSAIMLTPLTWLKDMDSIAFISFTGLVASIASIIFVAVEGLTYTGFALQRQPIGWLNWHSLPVTAGVFSFCFAGHAVFVSPLYTSMAKPKEYGNMLRVSFLAALLLYVTMAVLGVAAFGRNVRTQITLSMQEVTPHAIPTQAILWVVIVSPLAKYPLTLTPVAQAIESSMRTPSWGLSAALRTLLVAITASIALLLPFFALLMSLIGAASSMTICVVMPCICYGKLMKDTLSVSEWLMLGVTCSFGISIACVGTYGSILQLYHAGDW